MDPLRETDTTYAPDNLIAGDFPLHTETVTMLNGQVRQRGDVLGKISANDKYKLSLSEDVDGGEVPVAILAEDCDASGGDTQAIVYLAGVFDANEITIGTGHTKASIKAAFLGTPLFLTEGLPTA